MHTGYYRPAHQIRGLGYPSMGIVGRIASLVMVITVPGLEFIYFHK